MKVNLLDVYDRGALDKERIHFKALVDIDLAFFIVLDSTINLLSPGSIQAGNKGCFWFTSYKVKAGENVVLYSRNGVHSSETRKDGSVFHFFFRGLAQPVYSPIMGRAVIFEVNGWGTM